MFLNFLFKIYGSTIITIENTSNDLMLSTKSNHVFRGNYFTADFQKLELTFDYDINGEIEKFGSAEETSLRLTKILPGATVKTFDIYSKTEQKYNLQDCDELIISFVRFKNTRILINFIPLEVEVCIVEVNDTAFITTIKNKSESLPLILENVEKWNMYLHRQGGTIISVKNDDGLNNFTVEFLKATLKKRD